MDAKVNWHPNLYHSDKEILLPECGGADLGGRFVGFCESQIDESRSNLND